MWIRKRSQQKRIDNTKDSCRCVNANRKRKDANGGQSSVLSELTESIAQVLPRRLPAGRCYRFRCDFKTASLQPDLPCGILSAHTVSHFLESEFADHGFSQYRDVIETRAPPRPLRIDDVARRLEDTQAGETALRNDVRKAF